MTDDFNLDAEARPNGLIGVFVGMLPARVCAAHGNPLGACMLCNIEELESKTVV